MGGSFRIVDQEEIDLSAALFVVGFPGVGLVGSIATNFLVSALELKRIASVLSPQFPPMGVVKAGRVGSPVRIHAAPMVCGVEGECDQLAVVESEMTPKADHLYGLSEALLEWCQTKGIQKVVVLEGFARAEAPPASEIYGAANSQAALDRLERLGVKTLAEGILTGLSGLLSYLGEVKGLEVTCLLAQTVKDIPDARSAARLLEVLDPFVPQIKIDPKPLFERAEAIETHLNAYLQTHKESLEDLSERSRIMYG